MNDKKVNIEDDEALLNSFLKGSDEVFSSIYYKYVDELFAYGVSLGFERETLKDAIQDTYFKFYINKKQLKNVRSLKYYLLGMLRNRLLDIHKSTWRESVVDPGELPFLLDSSEIDHLIEDEEKRALKQRVNKLLKLLTNRQKEAVYLRFIQELEYDEIGNLLDMTGPAVRKLVHRAVKRMREENS